MGLSSSKVLVVLILDNDSKDVQDGGRKTSADFCEIRFPLQANEQQQSERMAAQNQISLSAWPNFFP